MCRWPLSCQIQLCCTLGPHMHHLRAAPQSMRQHPLSLAGSQRLLAITLLRLSTSCKCLGAHCHSLCLRLQLFASARCQFRCPSMVAVYAMCIRLLWLMVCMLHQCFNLLSTGYIWFVSARCNATHCLQRFYLPFTNSNAGPAFNLPR